MFFTIFSIFSLKAQPSGSNNKKKAEPEIYEKLITKADNELGLKNLEAAKALYQRALGLKSNDPYPKRKIDEIDKLLNSKNEIKSEPSPHLPDLGIPIKLSDSNTNSIINDTNVKRQKNKQEIINDFYIKNAEIETELNNKNTKKVYLTNRLIAQTVSDFDSINNSCKPNPADFYIKIELNVTRFMDSIAISDKKNIQDIIYRNDDLIQKIIKNESNKNKENSNYRKQNQSKVDTIINKTLALENLNFKKFDTKINETKQKIDSIQISFPSSNVESPNSIGSTYKEGVTEESFRQNDKDGTAKSIVTRRIVVKNGHGSVYLRTMTNESITYSKDNTPITEHVWQAETQNANMKKN